MGNISQFDTVKNAEAGVEMELKLLDTGKGSGIFIKLLGRDSEVYRDTMTERARQMADRQEAKAGPLTRAELDELGADLLARCTVSWRGLEGSGGPIEFSQAAARDVYLKYPAIKEQVNVFIADRANFVAP